MSGLQRAAEAVGGVSALAGRIGVGVSTVGMWKKRGGQVPAEHCAAVERASGVPRWVLRPDDWARIWPELIGTEGAPNPAKEAA